jgi:hypothetical protein
VPPFPAAPAAAEWRQLAGGSESARALGTRRSARGLRPCLFRLGRRRDRVGPGRPGRSHCGVGPSGRGVRACQRLPEELLRFRIATAEAVEAADSEAPEDADDRARRAASQPAEAYP